MKVYPVNAFEAASLFSPQKASHSDIRDVYNRYIDFTVDFTAAKTYITGKWQAPIEADSFILANSNALNGSIELKLSGVTVLNKSIEFKEFINITEFEKTSFDEFILNIEGKEKLYIGLLSIGKTWELPRFVTLPGKQLQLRSDSGRTFSGQVTGIPAETLNAFRASFARITNKDVKLIDDYINGVQTVIPHVIDPYYQAHDEFPPFFATISEYGDKEKRAENGFYWNFEISWMEAK